MSWMDKKRSGVALRALEFRDEAEQQLGSSMTAQLIFYSGGSPFDVQCYNVRSLYAENQKYQRGESEKPCPRTVLRTLIAL